MLVAAMVDHVGMAAFSRIAVTGGCGFIGSAVVRALLRGQHGLKDVEVTNLDLLTYAGGQDTLTEVETNPATAGRYRFVQGDVRDGQAVRDALADADAVIHLAAESHVDRAIDDPAAFLTTNVMGTQVVAEAALRRGVPMVLVSTDEVFGDLPLEDHDAVFNEQSSYAPRNPYAASKAAGDLLALSLHHTHGLDVCLTHGGNTVGPWQHPEKFVPRFATNLMQGKKVPLYGNGANVRDWMHVDDHADAIVTALLRGQSGQRYCVSAGMQRSNLEVTRAILRAMDRGEECIERVADRKGHDRRYAMDASKAKRELEWSPRHADFDAVIHSTVAWYRGNEAWWRNRV